MSTTSQQGAVTTPAQFKAAMDAIAASPDAQADKRYEAQGLVVSMLRELGYGDGADQFATIVRIFA